VCACVRVCVCVCACACVAWCLFVCLYIYQPATCIGFAAERLADRRCRSIALDGQQHVAAAENVDSALLRADVGIWNPKTCLILNGSFISWWQCAVWSVQHTYVSLVMSKDLVLPWISQLKLLLTKCCHYFTLLKVPNASFHWSHRPTVDTGITWYKILQHESKKFTPTPVKLLAMFPQRLRILE